MVDLAWQLNTGETDEYIATLRPGGHDDVILTSEPRLVHARARLLARGAVGDVRALVAGVRRRAA